MFIPLSVLLTLPALLSDYVLAVPSPAGVNQQPLIVQTESLPLWKSLSHRLIQSIWSNPDEVTHVSVSKTKASSRTPPPHTLARYGGDVVIRFNVSTAEEVESLAEAADTLLLDVWEYAQDWVDIRLSKYIVPSLLGLLPTSLQQKHRPLLGERELAQAIFETFPEPRGQAPPHSTSAVPQLRNRPLSLQPKDDGDSNIFFADYQPLSVIEPWMRLLASLFTTHVRKISIGVTYEGREIPALRAGVHPTNDEDPDPPKRRTVLVTGGVHAREWISTSTVNYIAYSLITGYGKSPIITKLLDDFDFVFVPTLNPDGYAYSWDTDRLWRKNRQRTSVRFCQGIDLDRGYSFKWDAASTAGNPCSENFAGDSPFEAVESKRLADWATAETENNDVEFVSFLDLHSYSQQILYPYSYSCSDTPPGQENLEELALGLEKAIRLSSSLTYEVLAACEGNVAVNRKDGRKTVLPQMEAQGGSALDWFYHEMHVRYAYQIKLRDRGTYGFLLPKEHILPTGKEILGAVLHLGQFLQEIYLADSGRTIEVEDYVPEKEFTSETTKQVEDDARVMVEDLSEEGLMQHDLEENTQWDLRRRRKR